MGGKFATLISPDLLMSEIPRSEAEGNLERCRISSALLEIEAKLRCHRPVLVGHNSFHDLCFLYEKFLRPLPESLAAFKRDLGHFFPRVIDTKYLATCESSTTHKMGDRNLRDLYLEVSSAWLPAIRHVRNPYRKDCAHEAGFDSWMTMVVFARISVAQLRAEPYFALEDDALRRKKKQQQQQQQQLMPNSIYPIPSSPASEFAALNPFRFGIVNTGAGIVRNAPVAVEDSARRGGAAGASGPLATLTASPPSSDGSIQCDGFEGLNDEEEEDVDDDDTAIRRIPAWGTRFWAKYGNKVRVSNGETVDFSSPPPSRIPMASVDEA